MPALHSGFPPQTNFLVRFFVKAKGAKLPKCPCCGSESQRRSVWTMLCPFNGTREAVMTFVKVGPFPPLTLVCSDHPIMPTDEIGAALEPTSWKYVARQVRNWDEFNSPDKPKRAKPAAGGGA